MRPALTGGAAALVVGILAGAALLSAVPESCWRAVAADRAALFCTAVVKLAAGP